MKIKEKFDLIERCILECGQWAKENQVNVSRMYKKDGTVLTEVDLYINNKVEKTVTELFPEANFVSEEADIKNIKDGAELTFVLDPIDGTDVYSQGINTYAVALGILDKNRNPIGGFIYCPSYGKASESMFLRLDPGTELLFNGKEYKLTHDKNKLEQAAIGSKCFSTFDFNFTHGKLRCYGSAIIHFIMPIVFDNFQAAICQPACVWDVAASHAILKKYGMDLEYADGKPFIYTDDILYHKGYFENDVFVGTKECRDQLRQIAIPKGK